MESPRRLYGVLTPLQEFKAFYGDKWRVMREIYCEAGYFYCGPDMCICAFKTTRKKLEEKKFEISVDSPDTWYIHFLSGEIKRAFEIAPIELPHVAWERRMNGNTRIVETAKIRRRYGFKA
jgi:hypothetical protein